MGWVGAGQLGRFGPHKKRMEGEKRGGLSRGERKEPRAAAAAAATICGPHSLASGLAAGGDEERGSVSSTDRLSS